MQRGFVVESTRHIPDLVEKLQRDYAHIYVTRFYNPPGSLYRTLLNWDRLDRNSVDFELAFRPLANATLIDKQSYTCVSNKFLNELSSLGVTTVDICGIDTDACVAKCAIDLFEAGVVPRVLADYCASTGGDWFHNAGLRILKRFVGAGQMIYQSNLSAK